VLVLWNYYYMDFLLTDMTNCVYTLYMICLFFCALAFNMNFSYSVCDVDDNTVFIVLRSTVSKLLSLLFVTIILKTHIVICLLQSGNLNI